MSFFKKFANLFKNTKIEKKDLNAIYDNFKYSFRSKYVEGRCYPENYPVVNKNEFFIPVGSDFTENSEHGYYIFYLGKTPFVQIKRTDMGAVTGKGYFFLPKDLPDKILYYVEKSFRNSKTEVTEEQLKSELNNVISKMGEENLSKELYGVGRIKGSDFGVGDDSTNIMYFSMPIDKQPLLK